MIDHIIDPDTGEILVETDDAIGAATADLYQTQSLSDQSNLWLYRMARAEAKKTGLETERDMLIAKIKEQYDPRIEAIKAAIGRMDEMAKPGMMVLLRKQIEQCVNKGLKTISKSIKGSWGTFGFRSGRNGVVVEDSTAAAKALLTKGEFEAITLEYDGRYVPKELMQTALPWLRPGANPVDYKENATIGITIRATGLPEDLSDVPGIYRKEDETEHGNFYIRSSPKIVTKVSETGGKSGEK